MESRLKLLSRILRRGTPEAARDNVVPFIRPQVPYMIVQDTEGLTHIVRKLRDPDQEPGKIIPFAKRHNSKIF